jgi:predicted PurR-regulated permease PerM
MNRTESTINKNIKLPFYVKLACSLISIIAITYILSMLGNVVIPIAYSALFSILLHPICQRLEKLGVHRIVSILVSILTLLLFISGIIFLVSMQVSKFANDIPTFVNKFEIMFEQILTLGEKHLDISRSEQVSELKKYFVNLLGESRTFLLGTVVATTGTISNAALVPIYIFFFLLYRDFFRIFFHKVFKTVANNEIDNVLRRIYTVIQSYLVGLILVIGIVAALNTIGLLILQVEYALFFGIFAAFLILIPYIGIFIGSILPALMSLITQDSPWQAVGIIGVMAFVQFLEGNFITPNVVGSKVSINPLAAILVLFLGGKLWGISGLILALPLTACIKVVLDAVPSLEPFGFLLGDADAKVLKDEPIMAEVKKASKRRYKRKRKPQNPRQEGQVPPDSAGQNV